MSNDNPYVRAQNAFLWALLVVVATFVAIVLAAFVVHITDWAYQTADKRQCRRSGGAVLDEPKREWRCSVKAEASP